MVLRAFELIARNRIEAAIERGEFDELPGAGQRQNFDDERFVPPEQRMAYRLLKNAGAVPAPVSLRARIARLEDALSELEASAASADERERATRLASEIALLKTQFDLR